MKALFFCTLVLSPLAAHADDISINCDHDKIVFGDDDVGAGHDSTPSLSVNDKDVNGVRVVFRESANKLVYVITEPKAAVYHQYTFTVSKSCEDGGDDKGNVTVHQVGDGKGNDQSYACTCDVD